jgi:DNA-binding Xre family transcriptional regulator
MRRGIRLRKASYKKLWKLLRDRDMNKKMLGEAANVSLSSLSKLAKNETVNIEILIKICNALDCEMGDIMELIEPEQG